MRTIARVGTLAVLVAGLCSLAASAAATTAKLPELPESYLLSAAGRLTTLKPGVTYQASKFPIALRLTSPDRSWAAAQWKTGKNGLWGELHGKGSDFGGPPYFGWVAVGMTGGSPVAPPRGLITIITAYARTPSVSAVVAGLRSRGHGATYEATAPAKVAGFSGIQFDGRRLPTATHIFVPFSPPTHIAKFFPDAYPVYGEAFRIIVLNVRAKTVVAFIENVALPVEQFPAFLTKADQILNALAFPG